MRRPGVQSPSSPPDISRHYTTNRCNAFFVAAIKPLKKVPSFINDPAALFRNIQARLFPRTISPAPPLAHETRRKVLFTLSVSRESSGSLGRAYSPNGPNTPLFGRDLRNQSRGKTESLLGHPLSCLASNALKSLYIFTDRSIYAQ